MKQALNLTEEYIVVAIYGGGGERPDSISKIDGTPDYLHIHAIKVSEFDKLPIIAISESKIGEEEKGAKIYQWGISADKDLKTRRPVVAIKDILQYCNLGIGSAGFGDAEERSSFVGGGEVMILPQEDGVKAFRITKGEGVFAMSEGEKCWAFEGVSDVKSIIVPIDETKRQIGSRYDLLNLLKSTHNKGDVPFVASFRARFNKENFAVRSNGIYATDQILHKDISLFSASQSHDPVGGHLLGDSDSKGDDLLAHRGLWSLQQAKVDLILTDGVIKISPTSQKVIAIKDNPHEFRQTLTQASLCDEIYSKKTDHYPVVIIGGGIAGATTALKLAQVGIPSVIIERDSKLMSATSAKTPGRIGHGFHYRDLETAKLYLQSSITFLKEFCQTKEDQERFIIKVEEDSGELDRGLYFIHKDSQVPADELLKIYEGIRDEYKRLVELDSSNKIFGEVENFFEKLDLQNFANQVDISQIDAVIRTQEKLLNWAEFDAFIKEKIEKSNGLISVLSQREVEAIEYDLASKNRDFKISFANSKQILTASYVINASWSNIEELDSDLFPESAIEERANRIKLIASIKLANKAIKAPSMFTSMGPFSMFSNEGNGFGKTTFAPVTNMLDYIVCEAKKGSQMNPELREIVDEWFLKKELVVENKNDPETWRKIELNLELQPLYKRLLTTGLNSKEAEFFGKMILEGSVNSYPILEGSSVVYVGAGIVKSNGEVNIRDKNSAFHSRCDNGLKERQIGYVDFNGVKLFYVENQARNVVQKIVEHIRSNIEIEKEIQELPSTGLDLVDSQRGLSLRPWVSRYGMNQRRISDIMPSSPRINLATQETISYLTGLLDFALNSCYKEPKLGRIAFSTQLCEIIYPIIDSVNKIRKSESDGDFICEVGGRLNRAQNPFTAFSVIDDKGDIVVDSKFGLVDEEKRIEYSIPSLSNRDYVKKMKRDGGAGFFCGSPVVGSTSGEFMVPVGIGLEGGKSLTFGMSIPALMRQICTTQFQEKSAM